MVTAGILEIGTGDDDLRKGSKATLRILARTGVVFEEDVAAGGKWADDTTLRRTFQLTRPVEIADIQRIELDFLPDPGNEPTEHDDVWRFERLHVTVDDSVVGKTTLLDRTMHLRLPVETGPHWSSGTLPTYAPPSPKFQTPVIVKSIVARTVGSDEQGAGTLANPYRTFQRAIRDVPLYVPPGHRYIVDISGLGEEELPPGYTMPAIKAAVSLDLNVPPEEDFRFRRRAAVTIRADLQPFSAIPDRDTRILPSVVQSLTADPKSRILTLVLSSPRPSWDNDALKGALFVASDPSGERDGVVASSTADTLVISVSDRNTGRMPTAPFAIMEQSAQLSGSNPEDGTTGGALTINNVDSFAFIGVKFKNLDGVSNFCVALRSANSLYSFSYCDFATRFALQGGAQYRCIIENSYIHGGADLEFNGTTPTFNACVLDGVTSWNVIPGGGYIAATDTIFQNFARPVGETRPLVAGNFESPTVAAGGGADIFMKFVLVRNGRSHGMAPKGGGSIEFTHVRDSAGDAMRVDKTTGPIQLSDVELNGTAGSGIALNLLNGAQVNVNPTSIVTGGGGAGQGDFKVGNNAASAGGGAGFAAFVAETDLAAGNNSHLCRLTKR